jgi:anhydro-N-acetylmuramic acid kinase
VKELIRFGAPPENILVTGGGAYNSFLIEKIQQKLPESYVHVPKGALVEYKEALIMGFIGLLRFLGKPNVLSTVTGAREDTCSGALYLP